MNPFQHIKIILASKSPRRKQILEDAGFVVEVKILEIDEDYPTDLEEHQIAEYIAKKKMIPFHGKVTGNELVVTADSIVVLDGQVFGKPESPAHAFETLQVLSGRIHRVYTGVCLMGKDKEFSFTEMSEIKFAEIDEEEILYYIQQFKPFDKAGSYGIQDWIGLCKVEWIKGTFSNIMGLPMAKLYTLIRTW
ncbi:MAG: septum formation protein Maf [Saprospiraceae bacterium]|nr:septum formation protein Maf [Saprospiraceae bacterium]